MGTYREPASPEMRAEALRRRLAQDADRADASAERGGAGVHYDPPIGVGSGFGGDGTGNAYVPGPVTPTDPDDPDPPTLTLVSGAINSTYDVITLTFSRAVDLMSAQRAGRFTIHELPSSPPGAVPVEVTTAQTISTPDSNVVISLASPLTANARHTLRINTAGAELHAFGAPAILLTGPRVASFVTTAAALEVVSVRHNRDFTQLTITFNRAIDAASVATTSQFSVVEPSPSTTTHSPTGASASGAVLTLDFAAALPHGASLTFRATPPTPRTLGLRDTSSPNPVYLVQPGDREYTHAFMTDPAPAFSATASGNGHRTDVVFTNPVDRDTVSLTSALTVFAADSGSRIGRRASNPIEVSEDGLTVTHWSANQLAATTRYRVNINSDIRDIYGQQASPLRVFFTTRGPFNIVDGSISPNMDATPPTVSFQLNSEVNQSTLLDENDRPRIHVRGASAPFTQHFPTRIRVAADGVTVTLELPQRLTSDTQWNIVVSSRVTNVAGDSFNGVQNLFSVPSDFVMVTAPALVEGSSNLVTFQLTTDSVLDGGRRSSRLGLTQFRVRVNGEDAWHTQPQRQSGTTWFFTVLSRFAETGSTLRFEMLKGMLDDDGNAFMGGAGATEHSGWYRWEFTLRARRQTTELTVASVAITAANRITVDYGEDIVDGDVDSATFTISPPKVPPVTIASKTYSSDRPDEIVLGLSRNLRPNENIRLVLPAGIRAAADHTRVSAADARLLTYTAPRRTFTITSANALGVEQTGYVTYIFSEAPMQSNLAAHIILSSGIAGRLQSAAVSEPDSTTGNWLSVRLRLPLRAGTHYVELPTSFRSHSGAYLADIRRRVTFTVAGGANTWSRATSRDTFSRGQATFDVGYNGTIPASGFRTSAGRVARIVVSSTSWELSAEDSLTATSRRRTRSVAISRVQVIRGTGLRITVSSPPAYAAQWQFRGPWVQNGNALEQLAFNLTT